MNERENRAQRPEKNHVHSWKDTDGSARRWEDSNEKVAISNHLKKKKKKNANYDKYDLNLSLRDLKIELGHSNQKYTGTFENFDVIRS